MVEYRFRISGVHYAANPEAEAGMPDKEELALTLSGRKTKLRLEDFLNAAKTMGLEELVVARLDKLMEYESEA